MRFKKTRLFLISGIVHLQLRTMQARALFDADESNSSDAFVINSCVSRVSSRRMVSCYFHNFTRIDIANVISQTIFQCIYGTPQNFIQQYRILKPRKNDDKLHDNFIRAVANSRPGTLYIH